MVYDVIICGAGPAGASAALEAGKAGLKCIIIDKARFPRHKTCGGGLVARTEKLLPFNIDEVVEQSFHEVNINFPAYNCSYKVKKNYPLIRTVSRETFDHYLLQKCLNTYNIAFWEEAEMESIIFNNPLEIKTSKGNAKARFLIAADGANSKALRLCGLRQQATIAPAIETEISYDNLEMAGNAELRFDLGIPSKGYAWVFPKRDKVSVGAGRFFLVKKKINLKEELHKYFSHCGIRIKNKNHLQIRGSVIPISNGSATLYHKNILFTGDSAGLADPITAEGISSALLSGKAATGAVIQSDFDPQKTAVRYTKFISKNILNYTRSASRLAWFLYNNKWPASWTIKKRGDYLSNKLADVFYGDKQLPGNLFFFIKSALRAAFNKD